MFAGLSFFTFEQLKRLCLEYFPGSLGREASPDSTSLILIVPAKLLCGGLAGAIAQTVS